VRDLLPQRKDNILTFWKKTDMQCSEEQSVQ
jgi:hypothetical protein